MHWPVFIDQDKRFLVIKQHYYKKYGDWGEAHWSAYQWAKAEGYCMMYRTYTYWRMFKWGN